MNYPFPEVYRTRKFHDDWAIRGIPRWLQPWTYIPRKWTGVALPMPPLKVCGNAPEDWIEVQEGYPLAPDAQLLYKYKGEDIYYSEQVGEGECVKLVRSIHPVHSVGKWSVQAHYIPFLKCRVPLYFSISLALFGRRLHFNGGPLFFLFPVLIYFLPSLYKLFSFLFILGVKPDVTKGDWYYWVEFSITFKKLCP